MQVVREWLKHKWVKSLVFILPLILYFSLTIPLFGWIDDDAGISFAYARNLAAGNGLVSQPGVEPVEGYSNPLWVFVLAPFFAAGIFHPFIVPKALSLILVGLTFYLIHKIIQILTGAKYVTSLVVLLFLSFNASFVVWTCSGLENPFFAALITALVWFLLKNSELDSFNLRRAAIVGILAGGIALTRPDGIVYALVFAIVMMTALFKSHRDHRAKIFKLTAVYLAALTATFGSYFAFRLAYFGEIYPNTYFVKGGPNLATVIKAFTLQDEYLSKLFELIQSVFGANWWVLIVLLALGWAASLIFDKKEIRTQMIIAVTLFISCYTYLILPNDWMGEYRLATPFFVLLYLFLAVAITRLISLFKNHSKLLTLIFWVLILITAPSAFIYHFQRISSVAAAPPPSFASIGQRFGHAFNGHAEQLQIENASLLAPDLGGTLYYSRLRIYDLAGLCDKTIARTLQNDRQKLLDYIFEEIRPTFIHTHGWFTVAVRFDEDSRFTRDYIPFFEYQDRYAEARLNRPVMSGNYVRREAIVGKEELIKQLKEK